MLVAVAGFGALSTRECSRDHLRLSQGGKICTGSAAVVNWSERPSATMCSMARNAATNSTTVRPKQRRSLGQLRPITPNSVLAPVPGAHKVMSAKSSSVLAPVGKIGRQAFFPLRDIEPHWEFVPVSRHHHSQLQSSRRPCRILCYGDSNTAGYTDQGRTYNPYGESLSDRLNLGGAVCDVGVCGLNGHTAKQMTTDLGERYLSDTHGRTGKGLTRILDEDGPIDLVIIMTGTNDLARSAHPSDIVNDVALLHTSCHERGVPTIALAPPFGVCLQRDHKSVHLRRSFADLLAKHLEPKEGLLAFFDAEELVPQSRGEYWGDAIHFSASGHRMLGRCLAEWLLPVLQTARLEAGVPISPNEDAEVMPAALETSQYAPRRAARARSVSPIVARPIPSVVPVATSISFDNNRAPSQDIDRPRASSLPPPDGQPAIASNFALSHAGFAQNSAIETVDRTSFVSRSLSFEHSVDDAQFHRVGAFDCPSPRRRRVKGGSSEKGVSSERPTYREGDVVEVWSNSQQVWCAGRVKKVDGSRVTSEFMLPDSGPAKKILSNKSREIRHV